MGFVSTVLLLAASEIYTSYPVFGDEEPGHYANSRVHAVTDNGLMRELIVSCGREEGILVHDTVSDLFCDSKNKCHKSLTRAIASTCR